MNKLLIALCFISMSAFSIIKVGESVPNFCWKDINQKTVCMDDYKNHVKVLIYNAGWCPPCNTEMTELAHKVQEFSNKPVVFFSLSAEGWRGNTPADQKFLTEWKAKHKLNFGTDIKFVIAAAPNDYGRNFQTQLAIPNAAIVDKNNKLTFAEIGVPAEEVLAQVRKLNP